MDPEESEDILNEEQAYFDKVRETSEDLTWRLIQNKDGIDLEKSHLEHEAMERESEARRQQLQGDDTRESNIQKRRQKILEMLIISDPPPFILLPSIKENWIKRLSSENWRSELERLRTEIAAFHVSLNLIKSLSSLEDKLRDLNQMVSNPGIRLIEPEDE